MEMEAVSTAVIDGENGNILLNQGGR